MPTNNPSLPPAPDPPEGYGKENLASPIPPGAEKKEQVDFVDPGMEQKQNKKIIILSVVAVLAMLAVYGIYAAVISRKGMKNVKVSGNQVSFNW